MKHSKRFMGGALMSHTGRQYSEGFWYCEQHCAAVIIVLECEVVGSDCMLVAIYFIVICKQAVEFIISEIRSYIRVTVENNITSKNWFVVSRTWHVNKKWESKVCIIMLTTTSLYT